MRTVRLPPTIFALFHDAGYDPLFQIERSDEQPWTDNDEAHIIGMMRAIEVDLKFAKDHDE